MSWLITLLPILAQLLPLISQAWGSATGNSLQKVAAVVAAAPTAVVNELTAVGGQLFPALDSTLHAAAAALLAAESHTGATAWIQSALNFAQQEGAVVFGAALAVDGMIGPLTMAAIKALQTKLGIPVTGMFADAEVAALQAILAKV